MMEKLKIVFVGTPDMALVCLDNLLRCDFNIVCVVPPSSKNETYSFFKTFVEARNLNFVDFNSSPNEKEYIEKIKKFDADIGVVCSYNSKFSLDFLKTTKMGYINCHPSLLPNYRGGMPYFHIIKNNEKKSGITLHFMDETFDTGDIIFQQEFELDENETMGTLFNRTNFMIADALAAVLKNIQEKKEIKRIPQKQGEFKKAPSVNGIFKVNFEDDVNLIDALIRACNPFYSAYCYFRKTNFKILKAKKILKNHNFEFGKIIKANKGEILVAAKSGFLSLEVFQVGTWGVFQTDDFYKTFNPKAGEFFK